VLRRLGDDDVDREATAFSGSARLLLAGVDVSLLLDARAALLRVGHALLVVRSSASGEWGFLLPVLSVVWRQTLRGAADNDVVVDLVICALLLWRRPGLEEVGDAAAVRRRHARDARNGRLDADDGSLGQRGKRDEDTPRRCPRHENP